MFRMRKCRTVKVETNSVGGALLRGLYPHKARLRIDEAPNQPGTGHAIDPHSLPSSPQLAAIGGSLQMPNARGRRMRFIWREVSGDGSFRFSQGLGTLGLGRAREVIDRY